jgi:hypothetical protein
MADLCGPVRGSLYHEPQAVKQLYPPLVDDKLFSKHIIELLLLNKAIQTIPIRIGYAVWTGIGAAIVASLFLTNQPFLEGVIYHPPHRINYWS